MAFISHLPEIGAGIIGRAVTETLYVSPNGAGTNGKTWGGAFTTIQAALAAASTDGGDCTLIMISPHTSNYDIYTTGNPTYTGNYILLGSQRNWAKIENTHGSATAVMKFTGKVALIDLNFHLGTGNNGVIMTHGGSRITRCQFVGEDLAGSIKTCIHLDHATTGKHAKVIDVDILGNITYCRGILVDNFARSCFRDLRIHSCLEGIQIVGATSDGNTFNDIDIGECSHASGIALNLDAGSEQHFRSVLFHGNKTNVDDEVNDHLWSNIRGQFAVTIDPDDLVGETVTSGAGVAWGNTLTVFAADELDFPFRIVGATFAPASTEWWNVRFSADSGATYFDTYQFDANKREGLSVPSGTEFIFNAGTEITCEARSEGGGKNCQVWVEIQKI